MRHGKIVPTPKLVIDCSKFPNADDEYTPAQRRVIDARLDRSEDDLKQSRTARPFNMAREMVTHMKKELKRRAAVKGDRAAARLPDGGSDYWRRLLAGNAPVGVSVQSGSMTTLTFVIPIF